MARRIVRTGIQLFSIAVFTFLVIFFLDRNYRVLPNVIHGYMPQHHPGHVVTDIRIVTCSTLNPFSSCTLDPALWHRVNKDLYLGKAWTSSAFVHIQRKHEEELDATDTIVMDVSVGRLEPAQGESSDKWESREGGLWIRRSAKKKSSDSDEAITDVDVLYGDDATEARSGWAITGTPLLLSSDLAHSAHVTVRRGSPGENKKPELRMPDSGRLKIMQIADLHLSTGVGACRDAVPDSYQGGKCEADPRTLDFVTKILDEEKPNLVILSGDQVNGETAPDAQSAMFKIAAVLIKRKIPYAAIFGNHDDEGTMSREGQMAILESLPYSLSRAGPSDIDGVGNYYLEVLARGGSDHSALTIYMMDSHAYTPDERNFPGYDWIKPNQIEWFRKTAESRKKQHAEYTHRHMDIAFIHIPLPEYRDRSIPRKGEWREGVTAPHFNSGFRDALVEEGIVMVSAGHDHANDYCALSQQTSPAAADEDPASAQKSPALWMCYGGGVGFGGYGGYHQYHRRVRLFEVDTNDARIKTWKRLEYGDIEAKVDEQIIVDGGKPIGLPETKP